jgi:hypothetical protein
MSSIITQWRPATSPTTSRTSTLWATSRLRRLCRKASVGRDHHQLALLVLADVVSQHRQRGQVVDRPVEEALDLAGVQVDGDDPVRTGDIQQVGHQLGGDRLTRAALLVLP